MKNNWLSFISAFGLFFIIGCSSNLKPFQNKGQVSNLSFDEKLIWHQSEEFEKEAVNGNHIYEDPALEEYLNNILNRLFPDYVDVMRIKILKSPSYNAFVLPNGAIYINLGLLAAFENEAQIASVIGHEGTHFIQKHGAIQYQSVQSARAMSTLLMGIPIAGLLSVLANTSSIYGYSRKAELESDHKGFERLVKAGYAPDAAASAMQKLLIEVKDSKTDEPFFFSSHPKLEKRITLFNKMTKETTSRSNFLGEKNYQQFIKNILQDSARLQLEFGRYNSLISLLSNEQRQQRYGGIGYYYLAEAKRKTSADNDEIIKFYQKAIELSPEFTETHKDLGLYFYKLNKYTEAKNHLTYYLKNTQSTKELKLVEYYLNKLSKE
ncbi:M48 family metalloprotease [Aliikangiella maris]|uniref:M48 family metallopeptidase n=2 Tax=Aliikangiella maris TaxID=3162458 RepID=A0ABV3MPL3_9GAMM